MSAAFSPGQAALLLFGVFFVLLVVRVPVAFALGLACLPVLVIEDRLSPMTLFNETFKTLDKNMQQAVLRAGKEAGAYGRQIESSEDEQKLVALEKAGKLKRIPFSDRAQMKKAVDPVIEAYAKEIGADQIFAKINAIK